VLANLITCLIVFGCTLDSFYSYSLSLPLVSVLSAIATAAWPFVYRCKPSLLICRNLLTFFLVLYGYSFVASFFINDLYYTQIFAALLIGALVIAIETIAKTVSISHLLIFIIASHVVFFFLQFFLYILFDITLDFLVFFDGESQRIFGGSFQIPFLGKYIRPSGLFNEPGTYSTLVAPLIASFPAACSFADRRVKSLFYASLFSLVLSLSVQGVMCALIIYLSYIFSGNKLSGLRGLISVWLGLSVLSIYALPYLNSRFIGGPLAQASDTGISFRVDTFSSLYAYFSSEYIFWPLFGPGVFSSYPVPRDLSLAGFLFFKLGIIPSLFLLLVAASEYIIRGLIRLRFLGPQGRFINYIAVVTIVSMTKFNPTSVAGATVLALACLALSSPNQISQRS